MLLVFNIEGMGKSCLGFTPLIKLILLQIDVVLTAVRLKAAALLLLTCCFIVTSIVGICNCSMFCCMILYVHSSFAIILMGKRELIALLSVSSWCHLRIVWLFLGVPWVCLQLVIVVFPDHTHLLFFPLHTSYKRTGWVIKVLKSYL